jgi:predicted methyltransferase
MAGRCAENHRAVAVAVAVAVAGAEGDEDREKYAAIGESDRFTLRFVKPAS